MIENKLLGSSDVGQRLQVLSGLFAQAEEKINHIDESRQKNMNYAIIIFAGLFGFGAKGDNYVYQLYISAIIPILMLVFCVWDRRLHKISHGWQSASSALCIKTCELINDPSQDTTFFRYRTAGEEEAEWLSFQPVVFYVLILAGVLLFFMFLLTGH